MTKERREPAEPTEERNETRGQRGQNDPGSFIGRKPERVAETIPGGLGRKDERASAVATQSGPDNPEEAKPEGHREGQRVTDDTVREAGQNH